jgi:predicted Ser/Thr protein kinase
MPTSGVLEELAEITQRVRAQFTTERRVLSYQQYLELFAKDPLRHSRDACHYVRDAFDYFGREQVQRPWGKEDRFKLFDLDWLGAQGHGEGAALVGQERVQSEIYRILSNFTREGRPNRLPLLHGPNGSAKSTVARCIMFALEHYSKLEAGSLYRFHWVFPSRRSIRGAIGFGENAERAPDADSYAHLAEDDIDARLLDELRDHPLFLLPLEDRRILLDKLVADRSSSGRINHWLWHGSLSHKNRAVFDALLTSYQGDLASVLKHVQVERYFISKRYRVGAVTVGPELSVDAGERQVTADRSLGALPSSLQAITLFEAHGELVESSGGLIEFSDLLKRPLDAFKYLQLTAETGEVGLPTQNIRTNCVMLASANEIELAAFRQHHEFQSFRSRVELIRTPYLLSWHDERRIYDEQIAPHLQVHVAPHATRVAAMFAVLTRLMKPDSDEYPRESRDVVRGLTALEKLDLYATGTPPERLDSEKGKLLRSVIPALYREGDTQSAYEGRVGASPREMRTVLLDAAQNPDYLGLSPFAVLDEIDQLCSLEGEYSWLKIEPAEGGFHDHVEFRKLVRERLLSTIEDEFRVASNLVDDQRYSDLFERYIHHVSHWAKGEKIRNPLTDKFEEPDERLMEEVESRLELPDDAEQLRHGWINRIAAWAIEHPGERMNNAELFAIPIRRLRDAVFHERRVVLVRLCRNVVALLREDGSGLTEEEKAQAEAMVVRLCDTAGYVRGSVADAAVALQRERLERVDA